MENSKSQKGILKLTDLYESKKISSVSARLDSARKLFSSNPSLKYPFPNHSLIKIINFLISKQWKTKLIVAMEIFSLLTIVKHVEVWIFAMVIANGAMGIVFLVLKLSKELVNRQSKFFFLSIRWEWKCALIFSNYWAFHCILVTWFLVVFGDEVTKILCDSLLTFFTEQGKRGKMDI